MAAGLAVPPPSGTTNASTRRTSLAAGRASTADSKGVSGRFASRPPSATQWLRVMFAKPAMSGRPGTPFAPGTWVLTGTNDGSKAAGNDALLRAARASAVSAEASPETSASWSKVNSP